MSLARAVRAIYERMSTHYGPTGWWPGGTPFEIAIGAILTQNTAWTNVKKALANLERERLMTPRRIVAAPLEVVETALRPSGYFRQKAIRVRIFSQHLLDHYHGSFARMAARPLDELRRELLALHGIGPETADDIILYACHKPVFVIDAYTRRIMSRHGHVDPKIGYEALRQVFERNLPPKVSLFQEYHGLIVWTAKDFCRAKPHCEGCPLAPLLKRGQPLL